MLKSPEYYRDRVTLVKTEADLEIVCQLARQRPIGCIGVSVEFHPNRAPLNIRGESLTPCVDLQPRALAIVLVETAASGKFYYRFLLPVDQSTRFDLAAVFGDRLVVGHDLRSVFFALWSIGSSIPRHCWDTQVAERTLTLGVVHPSTQAENTSDQTEAFVPICRRYGIPLYELSPQVTEGSSPISRANRELLETAQDVTALCAAQLVRAGEEGALAHLIQIEMPYIEVSAGMEWAGVKIDRQGCHAVKAGFKHHWRPIEQQLLARGLSNVNSQLALEEYFRARQLLHLFPLQSGGRQRFDKEALKEVQPFYPDVALIYQARRLLDTQNAKILEEDFIRADGRVHPQHKQLSAETGRQSTRSPNVLALNNISRQLIIPEVGYGVGEADLSQIEVGIFAATSRDEALIGMFNSGDVYSAMAKEIYRRDFSQEDLALSGADFKRKHPQKREIVKTCTLALLYGGSIATLARRLNVSEEHAGAFRERFLMMFPAIRRAMEEDATLSVHRGHVVLVSGLRIALDPNLSLSKRRRLAANYPIQGSAAVAFKLAGNRLHQLYKGYGARLLIPLHDSYVFEAPIEHLAEVAELTRRVMCEAVAELFPCLKPRAEINIDHPETWNKDGDHLAFQRWIETGEIRPQGGPT